MGEDITFSIFWGLVGFIFRLVTIDTILYITALSVLIAFSIINYWMRICRRKNKMSQKKNKMSYFCDKLSFFQP
ncbi:hypothetical protein BIV71_09190 [Campylobacter jejuni]|nr:hypothetical protein [Campylobacter jejuni]